MKIFNKRVRFDYQILETIEAGIVLSGAEARTIRDGRADLAGSYAKTLNGELYLVNANIPATGPQGYDSRRSRKLLLHKNEALSLETKMKQKKLTLVPISVYTKGRRVKLELGLGKTKREFEKRASIKKQDLKRDLDRELK